MEIMLENKLVALKNLDKCYFKKQNLLKADIIDYYIKISPYLLPHISGRPFSMIFFPEGSVENSFFQKQCPTDAPEWLNTITIPSKKRGHIDWCTIENLPSLIYIVNKSVIEMHTWFSRQNNLDKPDIAVIDIDPPNGMNFSDVTIIAQAFYSRLSDLDIYSVPKTSGSKGIHIFISIKPVYTYEEVQSFLSVLCNSVIKAHPSLCTTQRQIEKRENKIYLDAVQFAKSKTIAMPYSLRVKSGALVSTPLEWSEVKKGLDPTEFNFFSIFKRISLIGDLMSDFYKQKQTLPSIN